MGTFQVCETLAETLFSYFYENNCNPFLFLSSQYLPCLLMRHPNVQSKTDQPNDSHRGGERPAKCPDHWRFNQYWLHTINEVGSQHGHCLKEKVNLHRIPTNGGPTTKGLSEIEKWLGNKKWDLIHFNWGLHDLKFMGKDGTNLVPKEQGGVVQVPLADYEKNLEKLVVRMKKSSKQLVWRNTTPIPPGSKARYVGDSQKYNEAAARVMKKH